VHEWCERAMGQARRVQCDSFGRITKMNIDAPIHLSAAWYNIHIHSQSKK